MSLLSHDELLRLMDEGVDLPHRLIVMPLLSEGQVGPGSIDLRLGTEFIESRLLSERVIDPFQEGVEELANVGQLSVPLGDSLVLHPRHFILGSTLEFIRLPPSLGGQVLNRSSWGRLGLNVATAVTVQPGFAGSLTLELVNIGNVPILLYPGMRVAQLVVWKLTGETDRPYLTEEAKYKAPLGPQSSRLVLEADERRRIEAIGRVLKGELA